MLLVPFCQETDFLAKTSGRFKDGQGFVSVKSSKTRDRSALDDSVTDPSVEGTEISDGRVREGLCSESQIRDENLVKSV